MQYCCLGKYGPYPAAGGASSGHAVFQDGAALVLDMGCGVCGRLLSVLEKQKVCGVVLTHLHPDHYSDALVYAQLLAKCADKPLPLYLPKAPVRVSSLLADTGVFEVHLPRKQTGGRGPFIAVCADGIRCRVMLCAEGGKRWFTGDSVPTAALRAWAQNADVLLCDAPFTEQNVPSPSPHMTAGQAAEMAQKAGVKNLWISHIVPGSDETALLAEAKEKFENSEIVEEMNIKNL
ncbi:MAG: MBL fold metallo-hydrolase [Acutalibacteraceae bacterium]